MKMKMVRSNEGTSDTTRHQHLLLVDLGNGEGTHDDDEHEEVVHGQALLDQLSPASASTPTRREPAPSGGPDRCSTMRRTRRTRSRSRRRMDWTAASRMCTSCGLRVAWTNSKAIRQDDDAHGDGPIARPGPSEWVAAATCGCGQTSPRFADDPGSAIGARPRPAPRSGDPPALTRNVNPGGRFWHRGPTSRDNAGVSHEDLTIRSRAGISGDMPDFPWEVRWRRWPG